MTTSIKYNIKCMYIELEIKIWKCSCYTQMALAIEGTKAFMQAFNDGYQLFFVGNHLLEKKSYKIYDYCIILHKLQLINQSNNGKIKKLVRANLTSLCHFVVT